LGPLGLGAANLGNLFHAMTDEQAVAILEAAWQGGIRYFDTAPHYGLGLSERRLGAFLATKPRSEFVLSTKVGRRLVASPATAHRLDDANDFMVPAVTKREWDFSADGIRRGLEESLERLSLDSVDVLYLHDPEEYDLDAALRTGLPALAALRDEGMVTAIGVGSKQTKPLLAAVRKEPMDLVMVAGRYTLLEQPAREELIPECRRRGLGVVAAAVFNSGSWLHLGPRQTPGTSTGPHPRRFLPASAGSSRSAGSSGSNSRPRRCSTRCGRSPSAPSSSGRRLRGRSARTCGGCAARFRTGSGSAWLPRHCCRGEPRERPGRCAQPTRRAVRRAIDTQ
jgi:D-threo-aldose 1-dehydrogenase